MTEEVLKHYFNNEISTDILYMDLEGGESKISHDTSRVKVMAMAIGEEFIIQPRHLLMLCDDAIYQNIRYQHLSVISFTLISSEYFGWDSSSAEGEMVANVVYDWDNTEIGYPITLHNLKNWKKYLETGMYPSGDFQKQ